MYKNIRHRFDENRNNNKLENIDQVYCVVMPQRRKYIQKTLESLDVNIRFFDAIKPEDLSSTEYKILSETYNSWNENMYRKFTKLPVHLSYTMCFLNAMENGYKNIIILEDDITVKVNKRRLQESLLEFSKSDF
ncbi:MAG: glycosyltransferase family 25 protein, partial [Nitrososphaeraceae archaeon]|nr:glycosyltransferase family 25 protein [Nitrososphaeraceae archaeon]